MSIDPDLWRQALNQFNEEQFFECHETLETNWLKEENIEQRNLLQGIIHIAAAFLHYRKNNSVGYQRQLEKGLKKLDGVRLGEYEKKLNTNLSEFYQSIGRIGSSSSLPKIQFISSGASL